MILSGFSSRGAPVYKVFHGRNTSMGMRWQVSPKEHFDIFQTNILYLSIYTYLAVSSSFTQTGTGVGRAGRQLPPA